VLLASLASAGAQARKLADSTPVEWFFEDDSRKTLFPPVQESLTHSTAVTRHDPYALDIPAADICQEPCGAIR
jgi:predicted kinase